MKIRKAETPDLDKIMEIYVSAREFMVRNGNPNQWGPTNWPPKELIEEDIIIGKSYVCVDDKGDISGVFFFDVGQDIEFTYRNIHDGEWKCDSPYGVVHRIAVKNPNMGIGRFCLNWAYKKSEHLRIDTHPDNLIMQGLLENMGFEKRGIIYVKEDRYPRYAYEKV